MIRNSAHDYEVPPEDADLTHSEKGSPMGEVLRRFWQPVALSADLSTSPKKVTLLCEDVVLFRTKGGELGCLKPHCAHRGASLEWGRIEDNGIRCCYHGWLYKPDGQCVDMPCEPPGICTKMNVYQPAYPVMEYGGVVFVYMGPLDRKPLFPMYDIIDPRGRETEVSMQGMQIWHGYGVGYVRDCNWLQNYDNVVDPWHLTILHQMISGDQFASNALMHGTHPQIKFIKTEHGVAYEFIRTLQNGNRMIRYTENIVPNIFLVSHIRDDGDTPKRRDKCTEISWVVPVDNTHLTAFSIVAWPLENGQLKKDWRPGLDTQVPMRPGSNDPESRTYAERQRRPDDREAQEGQRPIAIHALEHLATSDRGIVILRRLLREQIKAVQADKDPQNILRDESFNHSIPTHAWNTFLSPEEAKRYDAGEVMEV